MPSNSALRLKALRDFDDDKVKRIAGDEWLFEGPGNNLYTCCYSYSAQNAISS